MASEGIVLFRELVEDDPNLDPLRPIYIIAITCHNDMIADRDLKSGYNEIVRLGNNPLIGCWFHAGRGYLDASFPAQFISDKDAASVGIQYEQDYILRIGPAGKAAFLSTH